MKKTDYVATFPREVQEQILEDVIHYNFCNGGYTMTAEEIDIVLNSRLCDLEEVIDIEDYIKGEA